MGNEMTVQITKAEHAPICPHCEKELSEVRDVTSTMPGALNFLLNLHVLACPHCRKVLGTAIVGK